MQKRNSESAISVRPAASIPDIISSQFWSTSGLSSPIDRPVTSIDTTDAAGVVLAAVTGCIELLDLRPAVNREAAFNVLIVDFVLLRNCYTIVQVHL